MAQFLSPEVRFREAFENRTAFRSDGNEATMGVIGVTQKGPIDRAVRITSADQFREVFGSFIDEGEVGFWIDMYFANASGTGEVLVRRVVHHTDITDPATATAVKSSLDLANGAPGYSLSDTEPSLVTAVLDNEFQIALSGEIAQTVILSTALAGGAAIAAAIQVAVRAMVAASAPNQPDYNDFICIFTAEGRYLLINGTAAVGKTVVVTDAGVDNVADKFKLGGANGGTEGAAFEDGLAITALSEGIWGEVLAISTELQNKVKTTVAADLVNGALVLDLNNIKGVVTGQYLEITDTTAPLNTPNPIIVEVASVQGGLALLTEPVVLTETINVGSSVRSLEFKLEVYSGGRLQETFQYLSMNSRNILDYVEKKINGFSRFINIVDLDAPTLPPYERPSDATLAGLSGGNDGLVGLSVTDFVGDEAARTGIQIYRDLPSLNFLAVPGQPVATMHQAMIDLAEELGTFQVLLDPPVGLDGEGIVTYVEDTAQLASDYASVYWPNVLMADPRDRTATRIAGPSAFIMGIIAQLAETTGIWNPPGGADYLARNVVGVEDSSVLRKSTRDIIYPSRINPITSSAGINGFYALGVQTLLPGGTGGLPETQQRTVVLKIKRDIGNIIRPKLISRPTNNQLLQEITGEVTTYLSSLQSGGAFAGATNDQSFVINFGTDLNPPAQLRLGQIRGKIGVAFLKAFEFAEFEISEFLPDRASGPNQ